MAFFLSWGGFGPRSELGPARGRFPAALGPAVGAQWSIQEGVGGRNAQPGGGGSYGRPAPTGGNFLERVRVTLGLPGALGMITGHPFRIEVLPGKPQATETASAALSPAATEAITSLSTAYASDVDAMIAHTDTSGGGDRSSSGEIIEHGFGSMAGEKV